MESSKDTVVIESELPRDIAKIFIRSFPMAKGHMLEEVMFTSDSEAEMPFDTTDDDYVTQVISVDPERERVIGFRCRRMNIYGYGLFDGNFKLAIIE